MNSSQNTNRFAVHNYKNQPPCQNFMLIAHVLTLTKIQVNQVGRT